MVLDRERGGREASPSAAVMDSQSAKTTEAGGPRGDDGAKKLTGRKRHALVVVAVLQNEAPFVAEWLEYHRLPHVGVSHFYLYDDGSTDGLQAVLAPYVGAGLVTLHPIGVAGELPTLLESAVETPTCGGRHERFLQLGADGVCRLPAEEWRRG